MEIPAKLSIKPIVFPPAAVLAQDTGLSSDSPAESNELFALRKAIALIANQVWRIGIVAMDNETKEPKSEISALDIKKVANSVENMTELMVGLGIQIVDRCNEDFHPGLPDQVVTEEPREGCSKERIIRTIRPTILWNQVMVQRGEIDIMVPITKAPIPKE